MVCNPSSPLLILTMIAYVVGFSFLLFYLFKAYSKARVVWKQFGSVASLFFCRICRFQLRPSAT